MSFLTTAIGLSTAFYLLSLYIKAKRSPLNAIPTVGHSGVLTSYITGIKYVFHARELIQQGYDKFHGQVFKVASMGKWVVIASGHQMLDDMRKARDEQLSAAEALSDIVASDHLLSPQIRLNHYHSDVVRVQVTRNLSLRFPDIKDELFAAFSELLPKNENDWTEVVAYQAVGKAIVRSSNRLLVGLPLCRDPDYMELQKTFSFYMGGSSMLLNMFPKFLRNFLVPFTGIQAQVRRAEKLLGPIIEERIAKIDELGPDYADKPNDAISWCLEYAQGDERTPCEIAKRILLLNVAAVHTTTMAFTSILYDLSLHPEYVPAMREEVEGAIASGWTKESLGKMRKLDSFIKESARLAPSSALSMFRKAVKDFTFSNGQFIPKGTFLTVAVHPTHYDEGIYPDATKFDGFRFTRPSSDETEGIEGDARNQIVSLSLDYLTFGNGRHACPGRFFVASELKIMLAYILLNYDVKLPTNERPLSSWFGDNMVPNRSAKVLFKKRR